MWFCDDWFRFGEGVFVGAIVDVRVLLCEC